MNGEEESVNGDMTCTYSIHQFTCSDGILYFNVNRNPLPKRYVLLLPLISFIVHYFHLFYSSLITITARSGNMTGRSGRLTGRSMTGRSQTQVLSQVHPHPCPTASYLSNNLYPSFHVCLSCIDSLIVGDDLPESFRICVTQLLISINRHY